MAWSKPKQNIKTFKSSQFSKNIVVTIAINKDGILHHWIEDSFSDSEDYEIFLRQLKDELVKKKKYSIY
jgi:hypothetical protein